MAMHPPIGHHGSTGYLAHARDAADEVLRATVLPPAPTVADLYRRAASALEALADAPGHGRRGVAVSSLGALAAATLADEEAAHDLMRLGGEVMLDHVPPDALRSIATRMRRAAAATVEPRDTEPPRRDTMRCPVMEVSHG